MKGSSILDHVPIEDTIHKENTIKPGPWSNASKRCPLMASATKAAFKGRILFRKKILFIPPRYNRCFWASLLFSEL